MTETPARLTIRLFGAPEVAANGTALVLKNQKSSALLFYLAATGQPHTRSHLATLLWSEYPADNARRSLRAALFQLRQSLQTAGLSHALVSSGDLLRLQLADDACDVSHFCRLLAEARDQTLIEAIALYRGPLLEGFTLPNAPLFDEWQRLEDERLTQAYLNALACLADRAEAQQAGDKAIAYLQRLVQTDPLAEEAQRQLIDLYLRSGAVSQALRQYQHFEAELQQSLSKGGLLFGVFLIDVP